MQNKVINDIDIGEWIYHIEYSATGSHKKALMAAKEYWSVLARTEYIREKIKELEQEVEELKQTKFGRGELDESIEGDIE